MTDYYNEIDPYAAQFLLNLIAGGHIPYGHVDTRSIEDVRPDDLGGYTQCHFFAGLGGWPLALQLAGWPRDRPVWTGSCPCQPFSAAGKGNGFEDERHLWPAWQHLVSECRPPVVFGEQVASKAAESWIDLVHADLEALGYAFGCIPFPAAGIGAPHIRDRNYWVAYADSGAGGQGSAHLRGRPAGSDAESRTGFGGGRVPDGVDNGDGARLAGHGLRPKDGRPNRFRAALGSTRSSGPDSRLAYPDGWYASAEREQRSGQHGQQPEDRGVVFSAGTGPTNGRWRDADWLLCRDGKWRPVEPGTFPLAHGVSGRVGRLRAYGNAIVPQAAAEFIRAFAEASGLSLEAA